MCWSIVRSAAPCSPPPYRRDCKNSAASATQPAAAAPTWGELYVRGLADGKRNSMQPMAPGSALIISSCSSSSRGFDPARFQTKPPVCYRAPWRLPGPDSHRQATTS